MGITVIETMRYTEAIHINEDNIETLKSYEGQKPYWKYKDLTHSLRTENELILSAIVDFYLQDKKVASV